MADRLDAKALYSCALPYRKYVRIADAAPGFQRKRESRITRFRRWLANPTVSYATYFLPFAQALVRALAHLPLLLIMDGTAVGCGCLALLLCVVYKGRALRSDSRR